MTQYLVTLKVIAKVMVPLAQDRDDAIAVARRQVELGEAAISEPEVIDIQPVAGD